MCSFFTKKIPCPQTDGNYILKSSTVWVSRKNEPAVSPYCWWCLSATAYGFLLCTYTFDICTCTITHMHALLIMFCRWVHAYSVFGYIHIKSERDRTNNVQRKWILWTSVCTTGGQPNRSTIFLTDKIAPKNIWKFVCLCNFLVSRSSLHVPCFHLNETFSFYGTLSTGKWFECGKALSILVYLPTIHEKSQNFETINTSKLTMYTVKNEMLSKYTQLGGFMKYPLFGLVFKRNIR